MKKQFVLVAVIAAMVGGCSLKKTAEDTAATTKEMNEKMTKMNKNTEEVKETSEDLKDLTSDLSTNMTWDASYDKVVMSMNWLFQQGPYQKHRRSILEWLRDTALTKVTDAKIENEEPDQMVAASATILAMWFQSWNGKLDEDGIAELDERMEKGVDLLFTRTFTHAGASKKVDVVLVDWTKYNGVAALGARLEENSPQFKRVFKRLKQTPPNFYDLAINALKQRKLVKPESKFPLTTERILQRRAEVTYMLQLRHNILPLMVVARMSNIQDLGNLGRLRMSGKLDFILDMIPDWPVINRAKRDRTPISLSEFGPAEFREWTGWLKAASETRRALAEMGIQPEYNGIYRDIIANVDFGQRELLAAEPSADPYHQVVREFAEAFQNAASEAFMEPNAPLAGAN